jgi:hypothetical protein
VALTPQSHRTPRHQEILDFLRTAAAAEFTYTTEHIGTQRIDEPTGSPGIVWRATPRA